MKRILLYIFSILLVNVHAQVIDDFNDGDFINNPTWSGTQSSFLVNGDLQLQLNATSTGEAYLSTPVIGMFNPNTEWHFFIRHNFASSSSNYSRFYLSSDQADLTQPLNGYYLQFGESLSNDAIELFRQDGIVTTSVCRATNALISGAFAVGIKVLRDSTGNWKVFADYSGGTNYQLESTGVDNTYPGSQFTGWHCVFTSGNVDKFYLDNFYLGEEILDTVPPSVTSLNANCDSIVSINFSERTDVTTAVDPQNYSIDNGIGQPYLIQHDSINPLQYDLIFLNKLISGRAYNLTVINVRDLANNIIQSTNLPINFTAVSVASLNDIVITEIYAAPTANSPLPNAEYIEIYNRKDSAINLEQWKISDGSSDGQLPSIILKSHEYALLFDDGNGQLFNSYQNAIAVDGFPTLNNNGDKISLSDSNNVIINEVYFTSDMYGGNGKDDGGWSLEKKDPDFTCVNPGNWGASVSSFHGTPGAINSINKLFEDRDAPYFENVYLVDSLTLIVIFSESVSADASDPSNFKITSAAGLEQNIRNILWYDDSISIILMNPLSETSYTIQGSVNIHDCPGNQFQTFYTKKFGNAAIAKMDEVIINEILFYCYSGGTDYVELYNASDKIIDLKDWTITETDTLFSEIKETAKISSTHKLFFPGDYLVLCEDEKKVRQFYTCRDPFCFINIHSMPDLSSTEGGIQISDNTGNIIASCIYSDKIHFPVLSDTRGVSLERISFKNESNNWHSAAATAGFGTPGWVNSQSVGHALGDGGFSLNAEVFSPDGDGYSDVLSVHYRCQEPGTVLSLNVFDLKGRLVRKLLDHQSANMEGDLFWDGLNDQHQELNSGIYVILIESYDLNGNNKTYKSGVYLTRKAN